jgi:hypothetical protein
MDAIGQPLASVPRLQELERVLFAPLPLPIQISRQHYDRVPAALASSFEPWSSPCILDTAVGNQCGLPNLGNPSEDMWGAYHGQFILLTLRRLSLSCQSLLQISRNQSAQSTVSLVVGSKRPDCMVHTVRGALVFLGEEKDLSQGYEAGIRAAMNELVGKLQSWNVLYMGELPYIICYAAAGDHVHFFALAPNMTLCPLHRDPIVVSTVRGALQLAVATINAFRLLNTLRWSGPQIGAPTLLSVMVRQDCTITFQANSVSKVYHTAHKRPRPAELPLGLARRGPLTERDIDRLREFFTRLFELPLRPDCLEVPVGRPSALTDASGNYHTLQVNVCPVGIMRKPETQEEFAHFFRCILRALDILHAQLGYVHGDVRWPNVITAPVPGEAAGTRWCLIDFGEVMPIGEGISPEADLKQLAAMLMPSEAFLFQQPGFPVPLDRLCVLLRETGATAAGVLAKAVPFLG